MTLNFNMNSNKQIGFAEIYVVGTKEKALKNTSIRNTKML